LFKIEIRGCFHVPDFYFPKKSIHFMRKILVVGSSGQIGTELTQALRKKYGVDNVIAADLKRGPGSVPGEGPFLPLDILDKETLAVQVRRHQVGTIYLLAAMLSASGEEHPHRAWQLNMQGLLNTLEIARMERLDKIFWPSSIAVFGPDAPKLNCPQEMKLSPATVYGISKAAGEGWCQYYHNRFHVDVRSLRYPGLISHRTLPGGGTTDYAIAIFHAALKHRFYQCYLNADTLLPMMYMEDAVRATMELMEAPSEKIKVRTSYNIGAMHFTPAEISREISNHITGFETTYHPDFRQAIAESWPGSVDDSNAKKDWGWNPQYGLEETVDSMLSALKHLAPQHVSIF
jgi:nucleoside-diphosphate-sugar epimerase